MTPMPPVFMLPNSKESCQERVRRDKAPHEWAKLKSLRTRNNAQILSTRSSQRTVVTRDWTGSKFCSRPLILTGTSSSANPTPITELLSEDHTCQRESPTKSANSIFSLIKFAALRTFMNCVSTRQGLLPLKRMKIIWRIPPCLKTPRSFASRTS